MKRSVGWLCCLVLVGLCAVASGAPRPRPWASMLVSGFVDINPDGSVRGYTVDQPDKIPPVVRDVIKQTVQGWRFQVDVSGKVIARAKMSLRIVAKPVGREKFSIGVEGAEFADDAAAAGEQLTERTMFTPEYPKEAIKAGTSATVYVLVRVGRDGKVLEAGAEQVNFTLDFPSWKRTRMEDAFARASVVSIRHCIFNVPTKGPFASSPYWYARIPVDFVLHRWDRSSDVAQGYGAWEPYLPGSRRPLPWVEDQRMVASAPDAIPDSGLTMLDGQVRLVTNWENENWEN
jgi:hypothetical protein